MTLGRLLARHLPAWGSYSAMARAADISPTALLRAMKGPLVLGVEPLIRLADTVGESPEAVLRAAGKGDVADCLSRLYNGPARPLSALDRALLALPAGKKRGLLAVTK